MTDYEMELLYNNQMDSVSKRVTEFYYSGRKDDAYHLYMEFSEWFSAGKIGGAADVHHIPYLNGL